MNKNSLFSVLPLAALLLLASCGGGGGHDDGKMAEHMAMMKADSAADAKAVTATECARKLFTMFETGNTDGIEGCVAENMVEHSPAPMIKTTGLQGLKDLIAMHHGAFPDTKMTIITSAVEGDMLYVHYNMKGTNTGAMGDMPATNKAMDVNGVDIVRFDENGLGVEHWGYWEEAKMMEQLGLMPPPGEEAKK